MWRFRASIARTVKAARAASSVGGGCGRWSRSCVALPWVVWALLRTLGRRAELPARGGDRVHAVRGADLAAAGGRSRWCCGAGRSRSSRRWRRWRSALAMVPRAVAGPQPEARRAAARGDDVEPVARAGGRAGGAAHRARARRRRAEPAGAAAAADARGSTRRRARAASRTGSLDPRRGRGRARACCRGGRCVADTAPNAQRPRAARGRAARSPARRPCGSRPCIRAPPVNRAAAPGWREALAALPGSDARGDVQILAGDFNATLDHPEFRALLDRGYIDAADAVGQGST